MCQTLVQIVFRNFFSVICIGLRHNTDGEVIIFLFLLKACVCLDKSSLALSKQKHFFDRFGEVPNLRKPAD